MRDCPSRLAVFDTAFGALYSIVLLWFVLATIFRMVQWASTPSPLPIPLTPAPTTVWGIAGRLCLEVFAFRALARAHWLTWSASLLFHYGLLFVLIVHLRFVFPELPLFLLPFIRLSGWAVLCMIIGLMVLLLRRVVVDRLRYISAPSDYLHLVLLLGIAVSGVALKRWWPVDLYGVGQFLRGVLTLNWQALPDSLGLVLHISLVLLMLAIFPVSKLMHGIGIVFSPTLNQRDKAGDKASETQRRRPPVK